MNNKRLIKILKTRGIIHQEQFGFSEMVSGIQNDARIVCAEIEEEEGFHGISFWIYGEQQNWFLGLWSGVYFKITDPEMIEEMIVELFAGDQIPKGKPPFVIPTEFAEKYRLILLEGFD
ncbi:MAG: hypothetical protein M3O30_14795 [Planctomycetota bacterium]|nr:hypothetical protein [Planctomycetota bacterium]